MPISFTRSKSLVKIVGRTVIEHLLDIYINVDQIDRIVIVSSPQFADSFVEVISKLDPPIKTLVIVQEQDFELHMQYTYAACRTCESYYPLLVHLGDNYLILNMRDLLRELGGRPRIFTVEGGEECRKYGVIR